MKSITIIIAAVVLTINVFGAVPTVPCTQFENKAFQLISKYEGWRASKYKCPAGKWTIGWGFTAPSIVNKGTITRQYADQKLIAYINSIDEYVNGIVDVKLTENQRVALVSLIYNIGRGNFESSTLLKKLNRKDYSGAAAEFSRWKYSKGKVLGGLVRRRAEERAIFCR